MFLPRTYTSPDVPALVKYTSVPSCVRVRSAVESPDPMVMVPLLVRSMLPLSWMSSAWISVACKGAVIDTADESLEPI